MHRTVRLRPATPDDAAGVYRAHAKSGSGDSMQWADAGACGRHLAWMLDRGGLALVAEVDGEVVGEMECWWGSDVPAFGRSLDISMLYLREDHHGRGIGAAMVEAAVDAARERGCATTTVWATDAIEFYRKCGFEEHLRVERYLVPTAGAGEAPSAVPVRLADLAPPDGSSFRFQRILHPVQRWHDLVREEAERDVDARLLGDDSLAVFRRAWWSKDRTRAELFVWSPVDRTDLLADAVTIAGDLGIETLIVLDHGELAGPLADLGLEPVAAETVLSRPVK